MEDWLSVRLHGHHNVGPEHQSSHSNGFQSNINILCILMKTLHVHVERRLFRWCVTGIRVGTVKNILLWSYVLPSLTRGSRILNITFLWFVNISGYWHLQNSETYSKQIGNPEEFQVILWVWDPQASFATIHNLLLPLCFHLWGGLEKNRVLHLCQKLKLCSVFATVIYN